MYRVVSSDIIKTVEDASLKIVSVVMPQPCQSQIECGTFSFQWEDDCTRILGHCTAKRNVQTHTA